MNDNEQILGIINKSELLFTNDIEDDRTNCYLYLKDYDWMNYKFKTMFKTNKYGLLNVTIEYAGSTESWMNVIQQKDNVCNTFELIFPTKLFEKHIKIYLQHHLEHWGKNLAFNPENDIINFYNDIINYNSECKLTSTRKLSEDEQKNLKHLFTKCNKQ